MTAAPDKPVDGAHLTLERTTAQTLLWFLGHRVTVGLAAVMLGAGVITASAVAAGSAPPNPSPENETPVSAAASTAAAIITGEVTIQCADVPRPIQSGDVVIAK